MMHILMQCSRFATAKAQAEHELDTTPWKSGNTAQTTCHKLHVTGTNKLDRCTVHVCDAALQGVPSTVDDHLFIIGDAAGHIDPLTGMKEGGVGKSGPWTKV